MTMPIGKTVITRDVGFENFLKDQAKEISKKYTAPIKNSLGKYSDSSIEKSNACSKDISLKTFSAATADIMVKSIKAAEPLSKQTARMAINTSADLTVSAVVNSGVNWMKKH